MLGAGVSQGFNLPTWDNLVARMYSSLEQEFPAGSSINEASEALKNKFYKGDNIGFSTLVRECLYKDCINPDTLTSPLLQAITSLLVSSIRGKASALITFNFDDLIEMHLSLMGFIVESETEAPFWKRNSDMQVLHPHGFLPWADASRATEIIFTESDYDRVTGRDDNAWNQNMRSILNSTTPIFLGLSGNDQRLRTMLRQVQENHPASKRAGHLYWGVRPTLKDEPQSNIDRWNNAGIATRFIESYSDLPRWLLGICRAAAANRS